LAERNRLVTEHELSRETEKESGIAAAGLDPIIAGIERLSGGAAREVVGFAEPANEENAA
jgi:hypothetical protein